MPTREEENQSLEALGYSRMPDEAPPAPLPPLPPKPTQDDYAMEMDAPAAYSPSAQTPVSMPSRPQSDEPQMSMPPPVKTTPPDAPQTPNREETAPHPKRTPAAVRQAVPAAAPQPDPEPGHVSDADILGLPSRGKNVGLPPKAPEPSATAQAPTGENPYEQKPDGIEDKSFDKSAKTRQIQAEGAAADNRSLDLIGEKGDIVEAAGEQRGAINQARVDQAVKSIGEARDHQAAAGERYEDSRAQMDGELKALKEKMGKPPFDTVGLVMGLAGALAAAHGKPEVGRMLQQGVGGAINSRMKRWQGEIEGGQQHLEGMGKLVNMDRLHAADEQQGSLAIQKAVTAEFDSAIDEARAQADTAEKKNALDMLQNDFRKKLGDNEVSVRAKAAAAAHRRMVNKKIADAPSEAERQHIAEHYGDVGRSIDSANLKNQTGRAKLGSELLDQNETVAKTGLANAQAAKERAKAEGKPYTGFIPGKTFTRDLPSGLESKVGEKAMAYGGISTGYNQLLRLSEKVKKGGNRWNAEDMAEANTIREKMVGQESNFNGLGAPTGKEHDQVISGIADPQAFFQRADSYELLKRASRNVKENYDSSLKGIGIYDEGDPNAQRGVGGAGGAPERRRVRFSDGEERDLSPAEIQALQKTGSRLEAVD